MDYFTSLCKDTTTNRKCMMIKTKVYDINEGYLNRTDQDYYMKAITKIK
jgi:hypothetical protein